jgi:hypothetical protein
MVHGLIGAAALTLLIYAWWTVGLPAGAQLAVILLLVAAGRWRRDEPDVPLAPAAAAEVLDRRDTRCSQSRAS